MIEIISQEWRQIYSTVVDDTKTISTAQATVQSNLLLSKINKLISLSYIDPLQKLNLSEKCNLNTAKNITFEYAISYNSAVFFAFARLFY